MNTHRRRPRRAIVAVLLAPIVVAASGLLASCDGGAQVEGAPELGALPTVRSEADLVLPLDHYLPTPRERAVIATARSEVTAQCMEKLGFVGYPVDSYLAQTKVPLHGNAFLVFDEAIARAHGYRAGFEQPLLAQADDIAARSAAWDRPEVSTALNGPGVAPRAAIEERSTAEPTGVPAAGCAGTAPRDLYAAVGAPPPEPVNWIDELQGDAFARASQDPRLAPVTAAWSGCMKAAGYDYATPADANDDERWADAGAGAKQAALTDVRCKWSSRYLDTYVALVAAYETRVIEKNAERLQEARETRQRLLAAIAAKGLGRIRDVGGR